MAIRAGFVGAVLLIPLFVGGCYRGYKSAEDLESEDRGPTACQKSCAQLGMHMSAFVLVQHSTSGCVCAPNAAPPGYPPPRPMPPGPAPQGTRPPPAPAAAPSAPAPPASSPAPASPPPGPESQSEQGLAATAAAYVVIQTQRRAAQRSAQQNQPVNYNHP